MSESCQTCHAYHTCRTYHTLAHFAQLADLCFFLFVGEQNKIMLRKIRVKTHSQCYTLTKYRMLLDMKQKMYGFIG